jgi:polysaccharide deacetylase 2 family uncharacterized protein YibQ
MARHVKRRVKGDRTGSRPGWSWRAAGLLAGAALAFASGIGVGVIMGDRNGGEEAKAPAGPVHAHRSEKPAVPPPAERAFAPPLANRPPAPVAAPVEKPAKPEPPPKRWETATWEANALPFTVAPGTPLIAIVLDDMGIDRRRSDRATRLPGPLTLSYLSYAGDLAAQTGAARARGHELMLHLPMEPEGEADPGPGALLVRLGDAELRERIDFALGRFPGFVAVNNHMGSRFSADTGRMAVVFDAMRRSGHLFLDSLTTRNAVAMSLGPKMGVPTIARDVFLDDVDSQDEVWFRLLKAEQIAEQQGTAIAIGHPRDATLAVLEDWIAELQHRSARLAPVSAVARVRLGRQLQVMAKP